MPVAVVFLDPREAKTVASDLDGAFQCNLRVPGLDRLLTGMLEEGIPILQMPRERRRGQHFADGFAA